MITGANSGINKSVELLRHDCRKAAVLKSQLIILYNILKNILRSTVNILELEIESIIIRA